MSPSRSPLTASPTPTASEPATVAMQLDGVASSGPRNVWAVGFAGTTTLEQRSLIEHWDGASWNVVPSPGVDGEENFLHAVSAASSNEVWAVGHHGIGDLLRPLI